MAYFEFRRTSWASQGYFLVAIILEGSGSGSSVSLRRALWSLRPACLKYGFLEEIRNDSQEEAGYETEDEHDSHAGCKHWCCV